MRIKEFSVKELLLDYQVSTVLGKAKQKQINQLIVEVAQQLIDLPRGTKIGAIDRTCDQLRSLAENVCTDQTYRKWANKMIVEASIGARMRNPERIIMYLQQCRMLLNHWVMLESLNAATSQVEPQELVRVR